LRCAFRSQVARPANALRHKAKSSASRGPASIWTTARNRQTALQPAPGAGGHQTCPLAATRNWPVTASRSSNVTSHAATAAP